MERVTAEKLEEKLYEETTEIEPKLLRQTKSVKDEEMARMMLEIENLKEEIRKAKSTKSKEEVRQDSISSEASTNQTPSLVKVTRRREKPQNSSFLKRSPIRSPMFASGRTGGKNGDEEEDYNEPEEERFSDEESVEENIELLQADETMRNLVRILLAFGQNQSVQERSKPLKAPKFSGKKSEIFVVDWIQQYEAMADFNNWRISTRKKYLPHYLDGLALAWFIEKVNPDRNRISYERVLQMIKDRFITRESREEARSKLENICLREDEDIQDFAWRIQKLIDRTNKVWSQERLIEIFVAGLEAGRARGIAKEIYRREPETFHDAIEIAEEELALEWQFKRTQEAATRRVEEEKHQNEKLKNSEELLEEEELTEEELTEEEEELPEDDDSVEETRICFTCGEKGHIARNCIENESTFEDEKQEGRNEYLPYNANYERNKKVDLPERRWNKVKERVPEEEIKETNTMEICKELDMRWIEEENDRKIMEPDKVFEDLTKMKHFVERNSSQEKENYCGENWKDQKPKIFNSTEDTTSVRSSIEDKVKIPKNLINPGKDNSTKIITSSRKEIVRKKD